MGQCSSCPEEPCNRSFTDHQQKHHSIAIGCQPRSCAATNFSTPTASCMPLSDVKSACNVACSAPQKIDAVDRGRAVPVSFRSPQSLTKDHCDVGFMQNSGGRGPNDWEEEVVAPETAWKAARHANETYSPRWNQWSSAQRYIDYSSPGQVKSTLSALADATWVLSNSPATPHIGNIIKDWSQSPAGSAEQSPQFGAIPVWWGAFNGKENAVPISYVGKENRLPELSPGSSICSRASICSSRKKSPATMKTTMNCKRASIRNSHTGRGL